MTFPKQYFIVHESDWNNIFKAEPHDVYICVSQVICLWEWANTCIVKVISHFLVSLFCILGKKLVLWLHTVDWRQYIRYKPSQTNYFQAIVPKIKHSTSSRQKQTMLPLPSCFHHIIIAFLRLNDSDSLSQSCAYPWERTKTINCWFSESVSEYREDTDIIRGLVVMYFLYSHPLFDILKSVN